MSKGVFCCCKYFLFLFLFLLELECMFDVRAYDLTFLNVERFI